MQKWLLRILFGSAALVVASILVALLVNIYDPPINPDVQKILDRKIETTEIQKKAYRFRIGAYSGDIENAEVLGQELLADLENGGEKKWQGLVKKNWWSVPSDELNVESLKAAEKQVQAYIKLMEYREASSFKGNDKTILGGPTAFPFSVHRYFLFQLSLWLDKKGDARVMDLLLASNNFMTSLMNNGTLFERLTATVGMLRNAEFLDAEKKRSPKLRIPREVIDSFVMPEVNDLMFGAMEEEIRTFARAARSIKMAKDMYTTSIEDVAISPISFLLSWIPLRIAYRPNEAVNKFANIATQSASTDCPEEMDTEQCIPDVKWADFSRPTDYISNPIGRTLVRLFFVNLNRKAKLKERRREIMAFRESFYLMEGR